MTTATLFDALEPLHASPGPAPTRYIGYWRSGGKLPWRAVAGGYSYAAVANVLHVLRSGGDFYVCCADTDPNTRSTR